MFTKPPENMTAPTTHGDTNQPTAITGNGPAAGRTHS
jgi:hypothetical protein